MKKASEFAAQQIEVFAGISRRLAQVDISVLRLSMYYDCFGGWELVLAVQDEAIKFGYDGKDQILTIANSPIHPQYGPQCWQRLEDRIIPRKEALLLVEPLTISRLTPQNVSPEIKEVEPSGPANEPQRGL